MADQRLTLAQCVPGLRVRCVDASGLARGHLQLDAIYVVTGHNKAADVFLSGSNVSWLASRFVLADPPPPVLTEELRAAVEKAFKDAAQSPLAWMPAFNLLKALKDSGLAPAPLPLPALYCGADAFEGEG